MRPLRGGPGGLFALGGDKLSGGTICTSAKCPGGQSSDGQMRPLGPPAAPSVISAAPVTARGTIINPRRATSH